MATPGDFGKSGDAADPAVGSQVGPYRVESILGEGGMGRVYRAIGPDGELVALKMVKAEVARDQMLLRRFAREARTAVRIRHPHLVPVLATGEHEGIPYLAQQFIPGGSLADRLEKDGPLSVATAIEICGEVAGGLDALHAEQLIHRDIKPANILLSEDGAFVADLGLAKDRAGSVLTRPGQTLGSMDYMAPEQIRGEDVVAQTDVYALGCVMFECISGRPPFSERRGMRILWAHLGEEPADPGLGRADVSPELSAAILQALAKDVADRPPTATAYADLLRQSAPPAG